MYWSFERSVRMDLSIISPLSLAMKMLNLSNQNRIQPDFLAPWLNLNPSRHFLYVPDTENPDIWLRATSRILYGSHGTQTVAESIDTSAVAAQ